MNRTMITAANTMGQLQKQLDVISNNIANSQTTGYKKRTAQFSELMYQQFNNQPVRGDAVGRLTPAGIRQGVGAQLSQIQMIMNLGSIVQTNRMLDFAIRDEKQFFKVLVERDGESTIQYTRNGAFYLSPLNDEETMLVNGDGHPILDENNNSIIFSGNMKTVGLADQGTLVFTNDANEEQTFQLGIVQIEKPQLLELAGDSMLKLPNHFDELTLPVEEIVMELNGAERGEINIAHQALEQSNVDVAEEMTNLIQTQRSYQFQARSITLADQMQGLINGIR
ncbi:flagellar hook-basal body protein [Bacillus kwashiorkori]|uniref:flagellar hook-basal body protein n=1 Tax=Bacillus kwashiorkori TaxID=1522318 RepID=UPI00078345E4|nr:flagellar hook-basal body protein [Bacillus kwashiorkori]